MSARAKLESHVPEILSMPNAPGVRGYYEQQFPTERTAIVIIARETALTAKA